MSVVLKPSLRAHAISESEVALVGENEHVALRGRVYVRLAPFLNDTKSPNELVDALADELAPELVYLAIDRLLRLGLAFDTETDRPTLQDAWLYCSRNGRQNEPPIHQNAVCVYGVGFSDDQIHATKEKISKFLRVVADRSDANFEIFIVDDYFRPELERAVFSAQLSGRTLLPLRPAGQSIWIGPFIDGGITKAHWSAFMTRLAGNRAVEATVLARTASFPLTPAVVAPEVFEAGVSFAALIATRELSGLQTPEVRGAILTFDVRTFSTQRHVLPLVSVAVPRLEENAACMPLVLKPNAKKFRLDGGHRICAPQSTLVRLQTLISPITGIIPALDKRATSSDIHVAEAATISGKPRSNIRENRILGRPTSAAGKGETEAQAQVSCVAEAIERYSCRFFGDEPRRSATLSSMDATIHPNEILLFSERQYRDRENLNKTDSQGTMAFNWIPEPFDASDPIEWTPLWSLTRQQTKWIPTALCYFGYEPPPGLSRTRFGRACSNGCASGNSIEEAILQGLLELIERDACALWWYNRVQRPSIELSSFDNPFFEAMRNYYVSRGRALVVLDLRTDVGVPVAMAVSWKKNDGTDIQFGLGCHLEGRIAVSRALCEMNQIAAYEQQKDVGPSQLVDQNVARWLREATTKNQFYVLPIPGHFVSSADLSDSSTDDITEDIKWCVGRLWELGYDTLVLDCTRSDIGFPTARVVVPGFRHFWSRLAPGRIYDIPVQLGWTKAPLVEEQLNPISFFL